MKVFIHTNGNLAYQMEEVEKNSKIGLLINKYATDEASNDDYIEDVEIYLKNQKDDLDKGKTFEELGIQDGDHLFIGRCKSVNVCINYAGKEFKLEVPPSIIARRIRKKSLEFFDIEDADGADLLLWINPKTYLDDRNMIGSVTDYPTCAVQLTLASKQDIQGSPSQEILASHLESADFQAGVFDGSWGIESNEPASIWPFVIIWVQSKTDVKYYFRFDLTGYSAAAPTAIPWNPEKNTILSQNERPAWNKRVQQVFKHWGKQSLYLPCDRVAVQGHPNWTATHSYLIWNPHKDTIVKYLNELHQTLNN